MVKNPGDTLQNAFDGLKKNMASNSKPSCPTAGSSKVDELEKLMELKNQGKITDDEYQAMKSKLMQGSADQHHQSIQFFLFPPEVYISEGPGIGALVE